MSKKKNNLNGSTRLDIRNVSWVLSPPPYYNSNYACEYNII